MDLTILVAIATCLITFILSLIVYLKRKAPQEDNGNVVVRAAPNRLRPGVPRRAQMARNRGARLGAGAAQQAQEDSDGGEDAAEDDEVNLDISDKVGAKKRAKLEAKAEKKAARELAEQQREERKKKTDLEMEERKKAEELEHAEETQKAEEERKSLEEKERAEHEEYLRMKQAFSVEAEGYEESEVDEQNLLTQFVSYIKQHKVVVIEDLASHFKLKTQAAIDRIKDLQNDDILTGVIDDRGKFIFVSNEEMEAVAKFIRQRGRVSITELAENSNQLINLTSTVVK